MSKKIISKTISVMLLGTMAFYTLPVFAFTKDETVYSDLDSKGNPYKTIVSTHINNEDNEKIINDLSDLLNIENTNGDEKSSQDGNNLIWDANGADIYYQGESQKELPIECNIKYELDGKEILAEELLGKSGKVKIRLEYTNKDEHRVNINGKNEKLYTPFVVVAGTTIENANNSNIEISNGKVINDGTKTIVLGLALPGMQESLNISKSTIDIPNNIEITMDTTDFEFNNIVTYVTPKIVEENDLEIFDKLDEIYNKVNTIKEASSQIEEGANELKEGTELYSEKSKEFNDAMNQFSNGVSSANSSYADINNGINTLNQSSTKLDQGAMKLNSGAEAISTNITTIATKLEDVENGITELKRGEQRLKEGIQQIENNLSPKDNNTQVPDFDTLNTALTNYISTLDPVQDEQIITALKSEIQINRTLKAQLGSMTELKNGIETLSGGADSLIEGTNRLSEGVSQIKTGADILAEKSNELSEGAKVLNEGTTALSQGTSDLSYGSNKMKNGLNILDSSSNQLAIANNELTKGATTLSDGANQLSEGITTFNKEAINTICNYINGDLSNMQTRVEKLQDLANQYNNFTMLNDGTEGNVKFIMIVDSIKKQENETNKQEIILNDRNEEKEEQ